MDFGSINYLALIVASVGSFTLGSLWYGPLFGKAWQKELGFTDEYIREGNMAKIFGSSFVLIFIMGFILALILGSHEVDTVTWKTGAWWGFIIGAGFISTSYGVNMLYQRRSFKLWFIDSGYQVLLLTVIGAVLGAWK